MRRLATLETDREGTESLQDFSSSSLQTVVDVHSPPFGGSLKPKPRAQPLLTAMGRVWSSSYKQGFREQKLWSNRNQGPCSRKL